MYLLSLQQRTKCRPISVRSGTPTLNRPLRGTSAAELKYFGASVIVELA